MKVEANALPDFPKTSRLLAAGLGPTQQSVRLRLCYARDEPFLRRLYRHTRTEELACTGWSESRKRSFCDQQFDAQHADYIRRFPAGDFLLVLHARDPIGRLYVDISANEVAIIDIALLPDWRGQGIGGSLLRALQLYAAAHDSAVSLNVLMDNFAARAFYASLGFVVMGNDCLRLHMRWMKSPSSP